MFPPIRCIVGLLLLCFLAVAPDAAAQANECEPKCRKGFVCDRGQCVGTCTPACAPNERCSPEGACVSACNPACAANEACSPAGACVSACNPPCNAGEICTPQRKCVAGCNPACGAGQVCSPAGRCVSACNPACPVGQACTAWGQCVSACNPACAANERCSPQARCVSACNPLCAANEICSPSGQCVAATGAPVASSSETASTMVEAQRETSPSESTLHVILGVGALYLPLGDTVEAAAASGGVGMSGNKWDTHVLLTGYLVDDTHTKTTGGILHAHSIYWLGSVYGLGFGAGLSYADFTKEDGGWDDSSFAVAAYVMPMVLRFGTRPQFQLALTSGAIDFFAHDVQPWGYLGALVAF